jgi:hypothetical protein
MLKNIALFLAGVVVTLLGFFVLLYSFPKKPPVAVPKAASVSVAPAPDPIKSFAAYRQQNGCIEVPVKVTSIARKFTHEMATTSISASTYPVYTCEDGQRVTY